MVLDYYNLKEWQRKECKVRFWKDYIMDFEYSYWQYVLYNPNYWTYFSSNLQYVLSKCKSYFYDLDGKSFVRQKETLF